MPDSKQRKVDLAKAREAINITHINCERCKARVARVADALQRERDAAERDLAMQLTGAFAFHSWGYRASEITDTIVSMRDELRRRREEGG